MTLALVRVDDRLLHGQVAVGWAGATGSKIIAIANDEVAGDSWLRRIYSEAAPQGASVKIWTLREAVGQLDSVLAGSEKTILVVKRPADLVRLLDLGARFDDVNVGGMHFEEGKRELLPYVYVSDEDVRAFMELLRRGMKLVAQDVPGAKRFDLGRLLDEMA